MRSDGGWEYSPAHLSRRTPSSSHRSLCWTEYRATADTAFGIRALPEQLQVGDVVFIHIPALPFERVTDATGSWTNHVGIVTDVSGKEPTIAESHFPLSSVTTLSRFVSRSKGGRVVVCRLNVPLTAQQRISVTAAAMKRLGVLYDTGFNLHSRRQFCSRFVREVLEEGTGVPVGKIETFSMLLSRNPNTDLRFWRLWYFGNIPWERETVSPAALLESPALHTIFDGTAQDRQSEIFAMSGCNRPEGQRSRSPC